MRESKEKEEVIERNKKISKRWRCGVSIPVPLACKANALPSELHPHTNKKGDRG